MVWYEFLGMIFMHVYVLYVFREKGSDASWKDDNEVPSQVNLYSQIYRNAGNSE